VGRGGIPSEHSSSVLAFQSLHIFFLRIKNSLLFFSVFRIRIRLDPFNFGIANPDSQKKNQTKSWEIHMKIYQNHKNIVFKTSKNTLVFNDINN